MATSSLAPIMTPLVSSRGLASHWDLSQLWLKNETILTASSGNAGAATAAFAARSGLRTVVLSDPAAPSFKLYQIRAYGAEVRLIDGLFNQPSESFIQTLKDMVSKEDAYLAFYWEPVSSAIVQGFEVIAEEIVSQLGSAPGAVLIPTGGGDHFVAQGRCYWRLWRQGKISRMPQLVAVQPAGACPLVDAVNGDLDHVPFQPNPTTHLAFAWLCPVSMP